MMPIESNCVLWDIVLPDEEPVERKISLNVLPTDPQQLSEFCKAHKCRAVILVGTLKAK